MIKVYGPYTRKDGRKHVIFYGDGVRYTQSYPRYLMEQHLGRELQEWEEVDHINEDFTDDRIENLQILTKIKNIQKSSIPAQTITFTCPECNIEATKLARNVRHNQLNNNRTGPFCSRECAGKFNQRIQMEERARKNKEFWIKFNNLGPGTQIW